jgi:hypothetical protein
VAAVAEAADVQPLAREPALVGAVVVVPAVAAAADVRPLAREPALVGAVVVVPVVAAPARASLLSVHVARPEAAVERVVSLAAAMVQA